MDDTAVRPVISDNYFDRPKQLTPVRPASYWDAGFDETLSEASM